MKRTLFSALLLAALAVQAATQPIVTLTDARGDDHGNGQLVYPQQGGYESGDLDLQTLQISRDDQGFWIEATFQNPIRNPAEAAGLVGSESLAEFARKGFYQFNLDIYIDTDRVKGSGNTFTLPGRQVRIDPGYAWERAVILTPRPEATRAQLLDILSQQYPSHSAAQIQAGIDPTIFFPTEIKVRGRTISFLLPASFIGNSDGKDWAVTAFVTAAPRSSELKISMGSDKKTSFDELNLGVMLPQSGHPRDAVGYGSGTTKPSPIFDLLTRSATQQTALLSSGAPLTGVSWGWSASNDTAMSANVQGVNVGNTPAAEKSEQNNGKKSFLANPLEYLRGMFREQPKASTAIVGIPVQTLLDPTQASKNPTVAPVPTVAATPSPSAKVLVPATAPSAAPSSSNIAKRLQALQQLFNEKVIDETEYKQQRQRILNEM